MILAVYFIRRLGGSVLLVAGALAGILILLDTVEQLRRHSGSGIGLAGAVELAALQLPGWLYRLLPLAVLLGAVAAFAGLARSSELVVTRAAGRSAIVALIGPVVAALVAGVLAVAVLNPLAIATSRASDAIAARLGGAGEQIAALSSEGLWLRQADATGQTVIHAARASADGIEFSDASLLVLDGEGRPVTRIEAAHARLAAGRWFLEGVKRWHLALDNPEGEAETLDQMMVETDLTPEKIRDSLGSAARVAVWDLPAHIAALDRAGFSSRGPLMQFHAALALPATLAAMVLIGACFTLRHGRAGGQALRLLIPVLAGFAAHFLGEFALVMGESGRIPVILAAWIAPVVAAMLSLSLLLHLEDG
jgi:lipopolysaccharide export system permease protein